MRDGRRKKKDQGVGPGEKKPGSWTCKSCQNQNEASCLSCWACQANKPVPVFNHRLCSRVFRHQHDMRRFVVSALSHKDKDEVIALLIQEEGLARFEEIVNAVYSVNAGDRVRSHSFQRILVPFLHLLTDRKFSNSTRSSDTRKLYSMIYNNLFLLRQICDHLNCLVLDPSKLNDFCREDETCIRLESLFQALEPVLKLCYLFLTRFTDAPAEDKMRNLIESLEDTLNQARLPPKQLEALNLLLLDSKKILNYVEKYEKMKTPAEEKMDLILLPETCPPPGTLHPNGPRHDNDHADFRCIQVLPTQNELASIEEPYLPHLNPRFRPGSWFTVDDLDGYLDKIFRLCREDLIATIRSAVKSFIADRPMTKLKKEDNFFITSSMDSGPIRGFVFRNVCFESLNADKNGISIRISFDLPQNVKSEAAYWEHGKGSKLLQIGSVVIVVSNAPSSNSVDFSAEQIMPFKVMSRDIKALVNSLSRPSVCISLLDVERLEDFLLMMQNKPLLGCEHVAFQIYGHFYSGAEAILESLQSREMREIRLLKKILPVSLDEEINEFGHPLFISPESRYDLRFLVLPEFQDDLKVQDELRSVRVYDFHALCASLHELAPFIILDHSQIDAFCLGLSKEVSLIQGPPGTVSSCSCSFSDPFIGKDVHWSSNR